ncbi:MAG: hypothetical protein ABF968_08995 [Acetobacter sp.]|uniref:hypothetical protein n=1 Tax=Acetobacter sp. TaxID=440 RepID=UPI0039E9B01B
MTKPDQKRRVSKVSSYDRAENDFYVEPAWAVRALLAVESGFDRPVMDPCAGSDTIPRTFRAASIGAYGCDIIWRSDRQLAQGDFRDTLRMWRPTFIVSNPPYSSWEDVVSTGLDVGAERICLILPARYREGQDRRAWYRRYPPVRIWDFSQRVDMPPGGKTIKKGGGNKQYAWFVWEKGHVGPGYTGNWLPIMEKQP